MSNTAGKSLDTVVLSLIGGTAANYPICNKSEMAHTLWNNHPFNRDEYCYTHVWQRSQAYRLRNECGRRPPVYQASHNLQCNLETGVITGSARGVATGKAQLGNRPEISCYPQNARNLPCTDWKLHRNYYQTNKRAKRIIKSLFVDKTTQTLSELNSIYCWAAAMDYNNG